ncbi:Na+/H+ antiporter [Ancylobacter novellus DSM 506]|uniref:Na+/H+ antiporter n=1 Tax=Ancylobacter novellus (strain ATCC 8093 / DSM 506 / JCM 20403 / CCM 1077 / IAM 12100 / NBRC 12443 / NCIMB 10456) TaxID=639283 RepID=D7A0N7_ANCN5|nr:Na+/H+ antiporter [Ancylobacter novellus]ADH91358.1 Na+/H+ antiporter [Ancylobacter novellus DSM 506]
MDAITTALILLLAVVASGGITRSLPLPVPLPLVQIVLGVLIAAVADLGVELKPEIFFLLFLPPLLFLDGWRIPKDGLMRDRGTILQLAFGLVVFTVLGVGLFLHFMIPHMPLAVAFALAAVISPTDPVAVSAIAARTPIPHRLMRILQGEALLNDASGLVCMRFAVIAALTGSFSLIDAFGNFLWLVTAGVGVGAGVTWAAGVAKDWITRRVGEETGSQILISLLIPFGAYMLAEAVGGSGILAAVSAGIVMSHIEQAGHVMALTRVRRAAFWDMIQFSANGVVFVLLGEQLPTIVHAATRAVSEAGQREPVWLIVYVVAINIAVAVLRFLWVWVSLQFTLFRAARKGETAEKPSWRLIAATSLAGTRGAVTLAAVLSLPLLLDDGSPFPTRDLAILLAAGVIIVSLLAASIGLPFLMKGLKLPPEPTHHEEEDKARLVAARAAIMAVERAQHDLGEGRSDADLYADAGARIMESYRQRIERGSKTGDAAEHLRRMERIERELRLAGIRAERNEFYQLARTRQLTDDTVRKLVRELDLLETRLAPGA